MPLASATGLNKKESKKKAAENAICYLNAMTEVSSMVFLCKLGYHVTDNSMNNTTSMIGFRLLGFGLKFLAILKRLSVCISLYYLWSLPGPFILPMFSKLALRKTFTVLLM